MLSALGISDTFPGAITWCQDLPRRNRSTKVPPISILYVPHTSAFSLSNTIPAVFSSYCTCNCLVTVLVYGLHAIMKAPFLLPYLFPSFPPCQLARWLPLFQLATVATRLGQASPLALCSPLPPSRRETASAYPLRVLGVGSHPYIGKQ